MKFYNFLIQIFYPTGTNHLIKLLFSAKLREHSLVINIFLRSADFACVPSAFDLIMICSSNDHHSLDAMISNSVVPRFGDDFRERNKFQNLLMISILGISVIWWAKLNISVSVASNKHLYGTF